MTDNSYFARLKHEREQFESMLASLESGELLSGVSPEFHQSRVDFTRRVIADLTKAIYAEEAQF